MQIFSREETRRKTKCKQIETIAREKIKSPPEKKKTKGSQEALGEEETEKAVENVKVEVKEEEPKVAAVHIPKPVEAPPPPPPPLVRQPPAEPEPKRFTMEEWGSNMRRAEEQKRAQEQKAKKRGRRKMRDCRRRLPQ